MLKKHSIFKKLVLNMLPISIVPFIIVLIFVFQYACSGIKNEHISMLREKMESYIQTIYASKSNAILKSDYIINNNELREWFEDESTELYYQLIHINNVKDYIQIINGGSDDTIMIYTDNPRILTSRFTNQISELKDQETVRRNLKKNDYMYFKENLSYDYYNRPYLTLYRQMVAEREIIIEVKAYIPNQEGFRIVEENEKYLDSGSYISEPIMKNILAVTELNTSNLEKQYLRYGLIFLMIGLLFCAIIITAAIIITSKTTYTINGYIMNLSRGSTLDRSIENDSPNDSWELKVIKKTINELISSVKEKSEAQYKTELEKKRLELNLLQSKIDPHVLYNSLSAISHKAFKDNDQE